MLESKAEISKPSATGSQILLVFSVFNTFSCLIRSSHMFGRSSKNMSEIFPMISNLTFTTRIMVDYFRSNFFSRETLNLNKLPSLQVDLKTRLSLQNGIFFQGFGREITKVEQMNLPRFPCFSLPDFSQSSISNMLSNQEKIYLFRATRTLIVA